MKHMTFWGAMVAVLLLAVQPCHAGTQDFLLVNDTGVEIYYLYVSETNNDDWEEDVLGDDILPHGGRIVIEFSGRTACLWDLMVADEEGTTVTWNGLDLCRMSTVVLRCNDDGCWADFE